MLSLSLMCQNTVRSGVHEPRRAPLLETDPPGIVILYFQCPELEKSCLASQPMVFYYGRPSRLIRCILGAEDFSSRVYRSEEDISCSFRPADFQPSQWPGSEEWRVLLFFLCQILSYVNCELVPYLKSRREKTVKL